MLGSFREKYLINLFSGLQYIHQPHKKGNPLLICTPLFLQGRKGGDLRPWTRSLCQAWGCSGDRFLCASMPVGEAGKDPGLVGEEASPVQMNSAGAGEEISTEQEAESTQLLLPAWKCQGAGWSPLPHKRATEPWQMWDKHQKSGEGWVYSQKHERWQQQQACNKTPPMSYHVYISPTSLST